MGAFDGFNLYQNRCHATVENVVKTEPFYLLTFLAKGQRAWGLENSEGFENKAEALKAFDEKSAEHRFPELIHIDEYRRRHTLARIYRNKDTLAAFDKFYRSGVVE